MQIILESIQELKELASLIGEKIPFVGACGQAISEEPKEETKAAAEKTKKGKEETKKEDKPKKEDKKEETSKVEAEVIGADTDSTELPKDAEVKEDNSGDKSEEITKEMVRALCQKAITAGKSAEVKNIVSNYGASKIPNLKEECYADVYKDVEALL